MAGFQSNRYYNDPQLGQAFSNLAGLFAPPTAQDTAAYATAQARQAEASRLAKLFEAAGGDFDKMGAAAGAWTPSQGYYAVDQGNAVARRGQDVAAGTAARGQDITAGTARYAADLSAETARQNAEIDARTSVVTGAFGPLNEGQVRPAIPGSIAGLFGLPDMPQAAGAPKPPSMDQAQAGVFLGMPPEQQRAITFGDTPIEQVLDPAGQPTNVMRTDAIGQTPYVNKGATAAPDLYSYVTADGAEGSALLMPDGALVDASTRQPLPQGTRTYKLQGGDKAAMTGATTSNVTQGNAIVAEANYGLQRAAEFRTLLQQNPGSAGLTGMLRGFGQDVVAAVDEAQAAYGGNGTIGSVDELRRYAEAIGASGKYDPALAQVAAYALEMAYLQAKMQDPGGEVNVREMERLLDVYDGGIAGNQKVLANLDVLDQQLQQRIAMANQLRGTDGAPAPAPGAGDIPTVATPAEAAALPSGTTFRDPNGVVRRVP